MAKGYEVIGYMAKGYEVIGYMAKGYEVIGCLANSYLYNYMGNGYSVKDYTAFWLHSQWSYGNGMENYLVSNIYPA